ncbi:MAG: response regulator [Candidatus Latescibacteria bacterium]|nr:response regulator [Candidatus Latescibacterota bacterium]
MPEAHGSARPSAVALTDEEWQQLPQRAREVIRSLSQQVEQLRKSVAELQLNENLSALFSEAPELLAKPATSGRRVLVADDSAIIRKMVRSLAEKAGSQLFEAEDGAEALRLLQEEQIDLLILDINMPKVNGLQVLQALRAHTHFKELPVVMLTTSSDRHDVAQAIAGRVQAYLLKDNREELAAKLLQLLQA